MRDLQYQKGDFVISDPPFGLPNEDFNQVLSVIDHLATSGFPMLLILDWRNSNTIQKNKIGELIWEYGWISGARSKAKCGVLPTHNTIHVIGKKEQFKFTSGTIIHRKAGFSSPRHCSFAKKSGHPFEKPVALMQHLIDGCIDAQRIIDPFAGSATTLVAAQRNNLQYLGYEIDEKWHTIGMNRLKEFQNDD